jgi:enoyl-[acyl-carrier-protein] reductase (NADH)
LRKQFDKKGMIQINIPPLMVDGGGTLPTMTYYGSQMVVEHYNMMGPIKAALESATRYLAAELGPKGIRVHARPDRSRPGPRRGSQISTNS